MALTASRIRALNAVMAAGSFAAAARRLHLSQPAVTQAVRDLESAYGVTLFERHGGQLRPTPLAEELCTVTERIGALEERAEAILTRRQSVEGGALRVGLGNSMPGMAVIGVFLRRFPGVRVAVELGSHDQIVKAVLMRRVDVGVLPDVPGDARFAREVVIDQDVVAIAAPDHPVARAERTTLADLTRHRLIFRSKGSATQAVVDRAFRAAGLATEPALTLDTRDGVYEAAAHGLGVGFMWRHGTGRKDSLRRVSVAELSRRYAEVAFRLDEHADPVPEAFFETVRRFRATVAPTA